MIKALASRLSARFAGLDTTKRLVLLSMPLVLPLVAMGAIALYTLERARETQDWLDESRQMMTETDALLLSASYTASSLNAYLLSGDERLLARYEGRLSLTLSQLERLKSRLGKNPAQQARLAEAETILREWQRLVAVPQIALRSTIGDAPTMNDVAQWVSRGYGKAQFDRIRMLIFNLIEDQKATGDIDAIDPAPGAAPENAFAVTNLAVDDAYDATKYFGVLQLLNAALDMETGLRGFLLTGNDIFLEPYDAGTQSFERWLGQLSTDLSDHPEDIATLQEIERAIDLWREQTMAPVLTLRREVGDAPTMDNMADLASQDGGQPYTQRFQAVMETFIAEQERSLRIREASDASRQDIASTAIIAFTIMWLCIGGGLLVGLSRIFSNTMNHLIASMNRLANRDYSEAVPDQHRMDLFGKTARALEKLRMDLLTARELMQQASKHKAIGELTGGVAHDFNNLLAVISGNVELLEQKGLSGEERELLQEVRIAADRSAGVTRKLLQMGRQATLEPRPLNLNRVVRDIERLLRRTLPETIEIELLLQDDLHTIVADPAQLESAVLNLALNARDAMDNRGNLLIATTNIDICRDPVPLSTGDTLEPGSFTKLTITDEGAGMSTETLQRALDPYFTTKAIGEGSGLGLSVVHGFMQQSSGALEIFSKPELGTSIELYFPQYLGPEPVDEPRDLSVARDPTASGRILYAEDEDQVRRTVTRMLRRLGYDVVAAKDGATALETFSRDSDFDLILSDVVMPGEFSGPELVKAIREHAPDLPAIFLSGYAEESAMFQIKTTSRDCFLNKPTTLLDLQNALKNQLEQSEREHA